MSRPDGYLLPQGVTVDHIVAEVARGFDITFEDIVGQSRARTITAARACAMAVVRAATDLSFPEIGEVFDRDHTTVMHHVAKVLSDPELSEAVRLVVEELSPPPRLFAVDNCEIEAS